MGISVEEIQRDLVGYGPILPKVLWPKNARIALNFVVNYEEGAEQNILDGDPESESYLTDLPGVVAKKGARHLSVESLFEYGSRSGIWRLLHLFESYDITITLFVAALALERNYPLVKKLETSGHEVAGHGYRWINYSNVSEELEREHIIKTVQIIQSITKKKVVGWYTGRRSINTRKLICEAGLRYDSDSYCDDLPYWENISGHRHLIIPYNLDLNDARYALSPGFSVGDDFFLYLKATFDELYFEGQEFPKMMTIGLHPRFSGRPGRCEALRRFIKYIKQYDRVWICKREEIADYWYQNFLDKKD